MAAIVISLVAIGVNVATLISMQRHRRRVRDIRSGIYDRGAAVVRLREARVERRKFETIWIRNLKFGASTRRTL